MTRSLDCIAHFLYWFSGMTMGSKDRENNFQRARWDAVLQFDKIGPGLNKRYNVQSHDFEFPSTKAAGEHIPCRVYQPVGGGENETPLQVM
jgi:hypothetical protein